MTTITCDLCNIVVDYRPIKVEVKDGEHPHNGSIMYKTIDVCRGCIYELEILSSSMEFGELEMKFKFKKLAGK